MRSDTYHAFTYEGGEKFSKIPAFHKVKNDLYYIFFLYFKRLPIEIDLCCNFCSSNLSACIFPDSVKPSKNEKPKSPLPNNNEVNLFLLVSLLNLIDPKN